jgi:hypothetical protein
MEHFDIILALARIALDGDDVRASQQLQRLREALSATDKDQAAKLARLLTRSGRRHGMAPMALEEMRATADGIRPASDVPASNTEGRIAELAGLRSWRCRRWRRVGRHINHDGAVCLNGPHSVPRATAKAVRNAGRRRERSCGRCRREDIKPQFVRRNGVNHATFLHPSNLRLSLIWSCTIPIGPGA